MKVPPIVYFLSVPFLGFAVWKGTSAFSSSKTNSSDPAIEKLSQEKLGQLSQKPIRVRVDGSTAMVQLNKAVKDRFGAESQITLQANGSSNGINALLSGKADIAASSQPLTEAEKSQGLVATNIGKDVIVFVVGVNNPKNDISSNEIKSIFCTGASQSLKVYHRPEVSGTRKSLEAAIGCQFSGGTTLARDNTTQMLSLLQEDGIGYASYQQVKEQSTVKVLTLDGASPSSEQYAPKLHRNFFYVTKGNPSGDAELFIKVAASELQ